MKYNDFKNNEKSFRSLTGLSHEQFSRLLPYYEESHNEYFVHHNMNGEYQAEKDLPVLLHDGTEREIPRPCDEDEQLENYGGKKKKHTLKNAVVITSCCVILFVSESVCGKMHDKTTADTMYSFPYPCILYRDTGYQGLRPDGVTIRQPVKKPRGRELTKEEKAYNREISSFRVRVEHAIGSTKRMRIVGEKCRLRANKFVYRVFKTCAALHNFRINMEPWHYEN